jgi:iron complex transport system ATP-binding protein
MKKHPTIIEVKNLSIGYKEKKTMTAVLENINLDIHQAELICLMGPNGCGKSTLLRTITGMQKPLKGEIVIEGKNISLFDRQRFAKKVGVVLTENISVGDISVYSLVSMGRYPYNDWLGTLREEDFKVIDHALDVTELTSYKDKNFLELSDGMKQKAMIARALAQDTPIILLDEPTAFLDIPSKLEIMQMLKELAHKFNKSIILSSHDLDLALQSADTIWLITKDGKIKVDAPEDLVLNGHFENAFNRKDIKFQMQNGIFKIEHENKIKLKVEGDKTEVFWTERALERIGISTDADCDSNEILTISRTDNKIVWQFNVNREAKIFYSIAELLEYLNAAKFQSIQ